VAEPADIVVVGAGAAGLMAAISAGRAAAAAGPALRIVAVDGARKIGAKILVAGGGRCNVTHHAVDESAYAGSPREQIRRVLRRFDVPQTVAFFRALGVELKREDTGKLFPTTDDAHTVLDALLGAAAAAGAEIRHPWRVAEIQRRGGAFLVREVAEAPREILAARLILATGGKALPRTGSDGHGYALAKTLGHTLTPRIFPALVPLTLPRDHFICALSGLTLPATLEVWSGSGRRLAAFTNSTLCTHFGLSGPSVLDISRYLLDALAAAKEHGEPPPLLTISWIPDAAAEWLEDLLKESAARRGAPAVGTLLRSHLPDRLVRSLCEAAGIDGGRTAAQLTREERRALVQAVTRMPLPVTGDRGFTFAEVTAGGVPLDQLNLKTMESRATPGLYLCGEICDVDGRIGGFNFQWAWASGFIAGGAAAASLVSPAS
jgi:predicted Rossmann fold flavoprotein